METKLKKTLGRTFLDSKRHFHAQTGKDHSKQLKKILKKNLKNIYTHIYDHFSDTGHQAAQDWDP